MLYTVGHVKSYEAALQAGPIEKKGRDADYQGGIVFHTIEEARAYLKKRKWETMYGVYGLETDLSNCHEEPDGTLYLINKCLIVKVQQCL